MKNMNFPRAAQKDGPAGCTTGQASGLHIQLGCGKGHAGGLPFPQPAPPFSAVCQTAFWYSLLAHPSVFCAACRKFMFFIWKPGPSISVIYEVEEIRMEMDHKTF